MLSAAAALYRPAGHAAQIVRLLAAYLPAEHSVARPDEHMLPAVHAKHVVKLDPT